MWISRFRAAGYSSFKDSGWVNLGPSLNIIVGQNNVGKSALLKCLVFPLEDIRHKSNDEFRDNFLPMPYVDMDLETSGPELEERIIQCGTSVIIPTSGPSVADFNAIKDVWNWPKMTLKVRRQGGQGTLDRDSIVESIVPYPKDGAQFQNQDGKLKFSGRLNHASQSLASNIDNQEFGLMYYFTSERMNISRSQIFESPKLSSNAGNLPAVLFDLQGNHIYLFNKIQSFVQQVIPTVQAISVVPRGSQECEIKVWADRDARHPDLGFPLSRSGTGISQVLAILTAVLTNRNSTIIVIDEISSFLNPSSVKSLMRILLDQYPHHQYIISTHSSDAVSCSSPDSIHLVIKNGYKSEIRNINRQSADDLHLMADQVGFSMMDVFGADRICWVEGQSEEICFPMLASAGPETSASEIRFAALRSPDIVSSPRGRKQSILALFERVIRLVAPLTRGCSYGVDREDLSSQAVAEIENTGRGRIAILPRRNLESFLIHPSAIASVLTAELNEHFDEEDVLSKIFFIVQKDVALSNRFSGDVFNEAWLEIVDGARLMARLFAELTDNRLEFRKMRHSPKILSEILDRNREHVTQLSSYVERLVAAAKRGWD